MINQIKKINQITNWTYIVLFVSILLITFAPFFKVGFTTWDDVETYTITKEGSVFKSAKECAEWQRRFYFIIAKPTQSIPYLIENYYFTKIVQYASLLICFIVFLLFLKKVFKENEKIAWLIFLLLFSFLMITLNYHIPIIAYPFYFTTSFSFFLGAAIFLLKYYDTTKYKHLIFSVILYALSLLFYENYLIFLLFMLTYILIRNYKKSKFKLFRQKSFYKETIPFIGVVILYAVAYFGFRYFFCKTTNSYPGSSFPENFSISNFFKIILHYNLALVPQYMVNTLDWMFAYISDSPTLHQANFWYILKNSNLTTIINIILQTFVYGLIFFKIKPNVTWKKIATCFIVFILFALSAHALVAMSEKYNSDPQWLEQAGYVTTFFAFFGLVSIIGLLLYSLVKLCYKIKILRYLAIAISLVFIIYNLVLVGYMNDHFGKYWQRLNERHKMIDKVAKRDAFEKIPENSIILTNNLTGGMFFPYFWQQYIKTRTDRDFVFYRNNATLIGELKKQDEINLYYLSLTPSKKSNDMLVVLSKIDETAMEIDTLRNMIKNLFSNDATIYYYSSFKDFNLCFYSQPNILDELTYKINDNAPRKTDAGYSQVHILSTEKQVDGITAFNIHSSGFFDVERFSISNIGFFDKEPIIFE